MNGCVDPVGAGVEERRLGDVQLRHRRPVEGGADLGVEVPELGELGRARPGPRCPGTAAGCPARRPAARAIFRITSSTPGTARSACSAARSAGCSQETAAISGKVWRGTRGGQGRAHGRLAVGDAGPTTGLGRWFQVETAGGVRPRHAARRERLVQIRDQVVGVLDPAAQPDQAVGQSHRLAHGRRHRGVGHRGRVADQALDPAERLGQREDPGAPRRTAGPAPASPRSSEIIPPKPVICRQASSCCGCDGSPG